MDKNTRILIIFSLFYLIIGILSGYFLITFADTLGSDDTYWQYLTSQAGRIFLVLLIILWPFYLWASFLSLFDPFGILTILIYIVAFIFLVKISVSISKKIFRH